MKNLFNKQFWAILLPLVSAGQVLTATRAIACTYAISPTNKVLYGAGLANGVVNVMTLDGCPWSVVKTNDWITIISGSSGTGNGSVNYTVDANTNGPMRTGLVLIGDQTFTITQAAGSCTYKLSTTSRTHGYGATNNAVTVTTSSNCPWTAAETNDWITITSGSSGTGTGTVSYAITANPGPSERTGVLLIADQVLNLTQRAPCTFLISPTSAAYSRSATNGQVSVTTSNYCTWTANSTNGWITIASATNGTGPGVVSYAVASNADVAARIGAVTIGYQSLQVIQAGMPCTYVWSTNAMSHGAGSETGWVSVTTQSGCSWSVVKTNDWITILSGGSGTSSGNVNYTVAANPSYLARTGVILIADQPLTVTQAGILCTYRFSPTNTFRGNGAVTGTVSVVASDTCPWTVIETNDWITIISGSSGAGNGTVTYALTANPGPNDRTGMLMIADQTFLLIQRAPCAYTLASASVDYGYGETNDVVGVTTSTNCAWSVGTLPSWITITSATNGTGPGWVSYAVAANFNTSARTGQVRISGQTLTVNQAGAPCAFALSTNVLAHGAGVENGSVSVTTSNYCAWSAGTTNDWITITSISSGTGNGIVTYTVAANPNLSARTGELSMAGQILTVTQAGMTCAYKLSPASTSRGYGAATGSVSVATSSACAWSVANTNDWIAITSNTNGTGNGSFNYTVNTNSSFNGRTGVVVIVDQTFIVTQSATPCAFVLVPASTSRGYGTATGSVSVATSSACTWSVVNTNDWIAITASLNGTGNGSVNYAVADNPSPTQRTGVVSIADQLFTVTQQGIPCTLTLSPPSTSRGYAAALGNVSITTSSNCAWTVVNTNDWIAITSSTNWLGNGNVSYTVAANPNLSDRTGVVLFGSEPFTVAQRGMTCTFALSPTNRVHGFGATTGMINVTTSSNCAWTVANTNDWLTITSGSNGLGSGNVSYTVNANFSGLVRTSVVMIADQVLTLIQRAATNGFAFDVITLQAGGQVYMRLSGAPAGTWELRGSSDLIHWEKICNLTNTTGRVEYNDPGPIRSRFYRAVHP